MHIKNPLIEEMFRDFKSGGDNLEDTNVEGNRLLSLIFIISFAYSMSTFQDKKLSVLGYKNMSLELKNLEESREDIAVSILVYIAKLG